MNLPKVSAWRATSLALAIAFGALLLGGASVGKADDEENWKDKLIARVVALEALTTTQSSQIVDLQTALSREIAARKAADDAEAAARKAAVDAEAASRVNGDAATLSSARGYTDSQVFQEAT